MKLKTLKDFEWTWGGKSEPYCYNTKHKTTCATEIKKEAIKHIKELRKKHNKFCDYIKSDEIVGKGYREEEGIVINWIKYFFNITKKDLNPTESS